MIRIGILGAARVASYAMIEPAAEVPGVVVAAVAARDPARAREFAAVHGIGRVLDSYAALIADPAIDAIYIALPPALHARWAIAAVAAGKPVLCEKPFALDVADAAAMVAAEAAHDGLIMEAQHSHYHALAARLRAVMADQQIGEIISADAMFNAPVAAVPGELRYDHAMGGGALWDLGIYPVYWLRMALGSQPGAGQLAVTEAQQRWVDDDATYGADIATHASLTNDQGAQLTIGCDMQAEFQARLTLIGTTGRCEIVNPLAPQRGHQFALTTGGDTRHEQFAGPSTYAAQLAAFRDAIVTGAPVATRGADSLATIRLLSAIDAHARRDHLPETAHAD